MRNKLSMSVELRALTTKGRSRSPIGGSSARAPRFKSNPGRMKFFILHFRHTEYLIVVYVLILFVVKARIEEKCFLPPLGDDHSWEVPIASVQDAVPLGHDA